MNTATTRMMACMPIISRLRSKRSARTPPMGAATAWATPDAASTAPMLKASPVSWKASQPRTAFWF